MTNMHPWLTKRVRRARNRSDLRPAGLLAIVIAVLLVLQPSAISNYGLTLQRVQDTGLVALGLTPLLILGEIDLSVGATMALAGIIAAKIDSSAWLGLGAAFGLCVLIGCVNAALVMLLRVTAFVATLGTMIALQGVALAVSAQTPVAFQDQALTLKANTNVIGPLGPGVVILFIAFMVMQILLAHTRSGRDLYAIGGNPSAAVAANIAVSRRKVVSFVTCSLLAGLAGVIDAVTQATADPNVGTTVLLTAATAAFVGGASLSGGTGSASGTTMAAIALAGISVGLDLGGVNPDIENVITGGILVLAIISNPEGMERLRRAASVVRPLVRRLE